MSAAATLELELTSDPQRLPDVRRRMQQWAQAHGWSERQGGGDRSSAGRGGHQRHPPRLRGKPGQRILVRAGALFDAVRGAGIEVRVRDFGKQVDPAVICGRDLDDVRPGGLGVHIIRAMTSAVEYRPADGGGMLVIMRKYKTHTVDANLNRAERG